YEKNSLKPEEIGAGSGRSVHWLCEKNHSWKAIVCDRSRGDGCPVCSNKRILAGYNDLVTTHPALALEWDYEKNSLKPEEIGAGSGRSFHWACEKNHSWKAIVKSRSRGNG